MVLWRGKARSLGIGGRRPQKVVSYRTRGSRHGGESPNFPEKTMCRQRHKSDVRVRETLFLACPPPLLCPTSLLRENRLHPANKKGERRLAAPQSGRASCRERGGKDV